MNKKWKNNINKKLLTEVSDLKAKRMRCVCDMSPSCDAFLPLHGVLFFFVFRVPLPESQSFMTFYYATSHVALRQAAGGTKREQKTFE